MSHEQLKAFVLEMFIHVHVSAGVINKHVLKHNACGILVLLKLTIKDCEMHCGKNYL